MRCTIVKSIDVEAEVDVDIDDLFGELFDRIDSSLPESVRQLLPSLDVATKLLARVTDEHIAAMPPKARVELLKRLTEQAKRYERAQ